MNKQEGLAVDTQYVLNRDYRERDVRRGLLGFETPIFDHLAADRFGRDN